MLNKKKTLFFITFYLVPIFGYPVDLDSCYRKGIDVCVELLHSASENNKKLPITQGNITYNKSSASERKVIHDYQVNYALDKTGMTKEKLKERMKQDMTPVVCSDKSVKTMILEYDVTVIYRYEYSDGQVVTFEIDDCPETK